MDMPYLERAIEYAPKSPGVQSPDLVGWEDGEGGPFLCSHCAGRIMARGCNIGKMDPVWTKTDRPCVLAHHHQ